MRASNRIRYRRHDASVFLYTFDLIELDDDDLRREPFDTRKATLASVLTADYPLQQVIETHLDVATFVLAAIAASDRPAELEPANAIASIPMARIEPRIAFVSSHLWNSRCSFGDIF